MSCQFEILEAFYGEKLLTLLVQKSVLACCWLENVQNMCPIFLDVSKDKKCSQSCKCDLMVYKSCCDERSFPRKQFSSRFSDAGPLAAVFSKVGDCHTAGRSLLSLWRCDTERCVKIFLLDVGHSQYVVLLCDLPNFQFPVCFLSSFLITLQYSSSSYWLCWDLVLWQCSWAENIKSFAIQVLHPHNHLVLGTDWKSCLLVFFQVGCNFCSKCDFFLMQSLSYSFTAMRF